MTILKAIGSFFSKIWRWIKDTAWVQPLLIVGAIFGVIFSIPSITKAIEEAIANANSTETFYQTYQKSMEGGADSAADKIIDLIEQKEAGENVTSEYGNKFFFVFVSENCDPCTNARGGFEKLKDNWGSTYIAEDGLPFNLVTVFTDEVTTETTTRESAFVQYMDRNSSFFEEAGQVGRESQYYLNGKITDQDLEYLESADPDEFVTPTILLVDFGEDGKSGPGVSEVMFGVTGADDYEKAQLLMDCWNGEGDFAARETK